MNRKDREELIGKLILIKKEIVKTIKEIKSKIIPIISKLENVEFSFKFDSEEEIELKISLQNLDIFIFKNLRVNDKNSYSIRYYQKINSMTTYIHGSELNNISIDEITKDLNSRIRIP